MNRIIILICSLINSLPGHGQTIVSYQQCDNCSSPELSPFNEDGTPYYTYSATDYFTLGQCGSDYGPRSLGGYDWHNGLDFSAADGDGDLGYKLKSVNSGNVIEIFEGNPPNKYKAIHIRGDNGHDYAYGHLFRTSTLSGDNLGSMVFYTLNNRNYIIVTDENFALGVPGGPSSIEYDGITYPVITHVDAGMTIGPLGDSNTDAAHVHFYEVPRTESGASISTPYSNHEKLVNPFGSIVSSCNTIHSYNLYHPDVLTPGVKLVYGNTQPTSIRLRNSYSGPSGNYKPNADKVEFLISPHSGSTNPNNGYTQWAQITGNTIKGLIDYGGGINDKRKKAPDNLIKDGNANMGSATLTGVHPYYGSDPFDDFFFSDFYLRLHKYDPLFNPGLLLAGRSKDAMYPDGRYRIAVKSKPLGGSVDYQSQNIVIDNFYPYIEGVNASFYDGLIAYQANYYTPGCSTQDCNLLKFQEATVSLLEAVGAGVLRTLKLEVQASEPLKEISGDLDGPLLHHTIDEIKSLDGGIGLRWEIKYHNVEVIPLGEYSFRFYGKDYSDNTLLNFDVWGGAGNIETIPHRINDTEWEPANPASAQGRSRDYKFRLGVISCTRPFTSDPEVSFRPDSIPVQSRPDTECECDPYADFESTPQSGGSGYDFDASLLSFGTEPLLYQWDFGDGAVSDPEAGNLTIAHEYTEGGEYEVVLTITDPCGNVVSQAHTIVVEGDEQLDVTITGPGTGLKGETIPFNAIATGGVPPYTYYWSAAPWGSPVFISNPTSGLGVNSQEIQFQDFTPTGTSVYVTVTDASGANVQAIALHQIVIEETGVSVQIWHTPASPSGSDCSNSIPANSYQIWTAFVEPLLALEPPLEYIWDFGNGVTKTTSEPSGQVEYSYPTDGVYNIKLKVCKLLTGACYETTRSICVGTPDANTNNDYYFKLTGPSEIRWGGSPVKIEFLSYSGQYCAPVGAYPSYTNPSDDPCEGQPRISYIYGFPDFDFSYEIQCFFYTRNTLKLNAPWDPNNCIYEIEAPPTSNKPWGCFSLEAREYNDPCLISPAYCNPSGSLINNCLVYVKPEPLKVQNMELIEGSGGCQHSLKVEVSGGARKGPNFTLYDDIQFEWKAYQSANPEIEIENFFEDNTAIEPVIVQDHPYFDLYSSGEFVSVIIRLKAVDKAGQIAQTGDFISFNPFRITAKSDYSRCPDTWSNFERHLLAAGGTGIYEYSWSVVSPAGDPLSFESGDATEPFPYFLSPIAGEKVYHLIVKMKDEQGAVLCEKEKIITVHASPLSLTMPSEIKACSGDGGTILGPENLNAIGGSGTFGFVWGTTDPSNLQYLSDRFASNPVVQNVPEGLGITYTLFVSDINSECSTTADVKVIGVPNDVEVTLPASYTTCNGSPIEITALLATSNDFPSDFDCQWSYPTFPRPDKIVAGSTPNQVRIEGLAATYSGTYTFTAKMINTTTGCYAEGSTDVTIMDAWKHKGYEPVTWFTVEGQQRNLWDPSTQNQIITPSPYSSNNPLSISWSPVTPSDIQWNGGTVGCQSPQNGYFVPTIEQPQITMTVEHKPTECAHTFKSIRYVIGDSKMALRVLPQTSGIICTGEKLCYHLTFDMHLIDGQQVTALPPFVEVMYQLTPPTGSNQALIKGKTKLSLKNNRGLYDGGLCLDMPFSAEGTYRFFADVLNEEQFGPQSWSDAAQGWNYPIEHITATLEIPVSDGNYGSNIQNVSNCLGTLPLVGSNYDMGLLSGCQTGAVHNFNLETRAAKYIEIHPDAMLTLIPEPSDGTYYSGRYGGLFRIDPCIGHPKVPENVVKKEESRSREIKVAELPGALDMSIQPNPFDGSVTLTYQVPELSAPQHLTITLYDFTGKFISVLNQTDNVTGGSYQTTFNVNDQPPGVYFYEIKLSGGMRTIKRGVKI